MAQVNAGRVRFVSRGEYNNTTQYYLFDLVNYEGSSYVAIGNTLGNLPTNTTYWQLIAEKGNVGSVGPVGPQGVGIASINKTSTEGLVDTYTITYTDGTTTTFQITNGEDGETSLSEFNALKERVEDLEDNQITLPAEGTNIHVENAAKARLYEFELEKESSQETTTGKNLLPLTNGTYSNNGVQIVINKGIISLSGTATSDSYINLLLNANINVETNITIIRNSNNSSLDYPELLVLKDETEYNTQNQTSHPDYRTLSSGTITRVRLRILQNKNVNGIIIKPMVYAGDYDSSINFEPYTGGQPSPNPDYPQEVKVVEGDRNLFDISTQNVNKYVNGTTGNLIYNNLWNTSDLIPVDVNTNYLLSTYTQVSLTSRLTITQYQSDGTFISRIQNSTTPDYQIIKTENNTAFVRISYRNDLYDGNKIQFIEGTEELPYVTYGNNYVDVKVTGKNLFDINSTYYKRSNVGNIIINEDSITVQNTDAMIQQFIWFNVPVTQNKTITISYDNLIEETYNTNNYVGYMFSDTPYISFTNFDSFTKINIINKYLTTTASKQYLVIGLRTIGSNTNTLSKLQIEEGSTATTYEEYKETTVPLPLNGNEIAGIGNYLDEYIVDKDGHCWLNKLTGKVVLDGSEESWAPNNNNTLYGIAISNIYSTISTSTVAKCLSNYFTAGTVVQSQTYEYILSVYNGKLFFNPRGMTLEQFKTWLSTHNTEVYYALETSELIDLNTTVDLKLFKGVNNITNSEDGNMRIRYVESIESIINDFDTRLKALEQGESL